jgi:dihydroneopterin aldolase/2-amino-4-hydroxy-6-hydroxymethyldihydropteridine diphosphokinase
MSDRIELSGIEIYARHGVLDEEQHRAQVFVVDLTVFADLAPAGHSDDLDDTIDYRVLADQVKETVGGESHKLLERVAQRVADMMLGDPRVERVVVTIHKPGADLGAVVEDVSVTVDRRR